MTHYNKFLHSWVFLMAAVLLRSSIIIYIYIYILNIVRLFAKSGTSWAKHELTRNISTILILSNRRTINIFMFTKWLNIFLIANSKRKNGVHCFLWGIPKEIIHCSHGYSSVAVLLLLFLQKWKVFLTSDIEVSCICLHSMFIHSFTGVLAFNFFCYLQDNEYWTIFCVWNAIVASH